MAQAKHRVPSDAQGQEWTIGLPVGQGVAVDYEQARQWLEKAAAQDDPDAFCQLGAMYYDGMGVTPSWRRAREYMERAIELGNSTSVKNMQTLNRVIAQVTSTW